MSDKEKFSPLDVKKEALEAEERIRPYILETPLEYSRYLSQIGNCHVFLKLENTQKTGSFKFRGAANMMLSLTKEEIERGVLTSSTGNHGAAFAEILEILGYKGTIYLPENATKAKVDVLRSYDVQLEFYGMDTVVTENFVRETAAKTNRIFIPPYNHPKIIGGQATIALELKRQLDKLDAVLVPVGGGGLASGIAGYLKSGNSDNEIEIIGCQPEHSPVMFESVKAGRIIEMESKPTLSDGTTGGIEAGSITFDICRQTVDDYILISEQEIAGAIQLVLEQHYMVIEGAAALSVASFIKVKERFRNKNVILIITGKRITLDKLKKIICK